MELAEALPLVAPAIADFARHHASASSQVRRYYFYCLKWMMRGLDQFARPRVSIRAQTKADEIGLGDLHQYRWGDQRKLMNDLNRKTFHWEHATQTSDLALAVLGLEELTEKRVVEALSGFTVVWVLKDENKLLSRGRRIDWRETYRIAGIKLMPDRRGDVVGRRNVTAPAASDFPSRSGAPQQFAKINRQADALPMKIVEHVNRGWWVFTQGDYSAAASSSPKLCRLVKAERNVVDGARSGWDAKWRAARRDRQRL